MTLLVLGFLNYCFGIITGVSLMIIYQARRETKRIEGPDDRQLLEMAILQLHQELQMEKASNAMFHRNN
jgi:hypothetical protein